MPAIKAIDAKEEVSEKLNNLVQSREKVLGVRTLEIVKDRHGNTHILAERIRDKSLIVWTSYFTGEEKTSYEGYHHGEYDLSLTDAIDLLRERSGKSVEYIEKISS
ncbi:hypothetical protein [Evansella clarkii]|uniref:hypothetical protein n=1 Tax=Evansella clarkii TaxID=79879 RepID=UPI00099615A6|nr:hypothetical protein [Evansella clarkii]